MSLPGSGCGCEEKGSVGISFTCQLLLDPVFSTESPHLASALSCAQCSAICSSLLLTSLHLLGVKEVSSPAAHLGRDPGSNCSLCSLLACALLSSLAPSAVPVPEPPGISFTSDRWASCGQAPWHLACPSAICFFSFINAPTSFIC